jgi:hypothetical protein
MAGRQKSARLKYREVLAERLSPLSTFERLVYLASLFHRDAGHYRDDMAAGAFEQREVQAALKRRHQTVLSEWLCRRLEEQIVDVTWCLSNPDSAQGKFLKALIRLKAYEHLLPRDARPPERKLFLQDFETVLAVIGYNQPQD